MWSVKSMAGYGIKGYYVIITGDKKILTYVTGETKEKEVAAIKLLNFTAYNELIIAQEDTV